MKKLLIALTVIGFFGASNVWADKHLSPEFQKQYDSSNQIVSSHYCSRLRDRIFAGLMDHEDKDETKRFLEKTLEDITKRGVGDPKSIKGKINAYEDELDRLRTETAEWAMIRNALGCK